MDLVISILLVIIGLIVGFVLNGVGFERRSKYSRDGSDYGYGYGESQKAK